MTRKEWRGAVIGMVMGDASLYKPKYDENNKYTLSLSHSIRQELYLKHKMKIVNEIFDYELKPFIYKNTSASTGNRYEMIRFCTRVHPRFKIIGDNMYKILQHNPIKRKPVISKYVLDNLTLEGLAYYYMDDGCFHKDKRKGRVCSGTVSISTCSYYVEELEMLRDMISDRYNMFFNINKSHKKGYVLRRGIQKTKHFLDLLIPYATDDMLYKFNYIS